MLNPTKVVVLKVLYLLSIIGLFLLMWWTSYFPTKSLSYHIGQYVGMLALLMMTVQFLLSSRLKIIEEGIGLDRMLRWHHFNGKMLTLLVLVHPVLVFFEPMMSRVSSPSEIFALMTPWHWVGEIAVGLTLLTAGLAIFSRTLRLNYEHWKWIHRLVYIIVILGFLHAYSLGSDMYEPTPVFYALVAMATVVGLAALYRHVFLRLVRQVYEIVDVVEETYNVRRIRLKPKQGKKIEYFPGQFAYLTLESKDLPTEEHPFTISAAPEAENLEFSIKGSGDFTKQLSKVQAGDTAYIEGPYGTFTSSGVHGPLVLIAGGIGITPFMSMLRSMHHRGEDREVMLLSANQTEQDIPFKQELEIMATANPNLKVVHIVAATDNPDLEKGRIDEALIKKYVADVSRFTFFVCGPPPMMTGIEKLLRSMGVKSDRIITEKFSLN